MIRLINGRGQLGTALCKLVEEKKTEAIIAIYHTWNVLEKDDEDIQKNEYHEFKRFIDDSLDDKIILISTYSEKENYYVYYKQLSEAYLLSNHNRGYVIKLPVLIGKGVCESFREGRAQPYGEIELMSVEDAAEEVMKLVDYEGLVRSFRIYGQRVPAKLVKKLIDFGKEDSMGK